MKKKKKGRSISLHGRKAAWQTEEAQRDRATKSDQINRAPGDKRENIETSSAGSDLG